MLKKFLYISLGMISLGLGIVGIFLPILPTTPFILLAAWAFSRSSESLDRWLREHPRFGPFLMEWRAHRVVPLRAKFMAIAMMCVSVLMLIFVVGAPLGVILGVGGLLSVVGVFLLRCPSKTPCTDELSL